MVYENPLQSKEGGYDHLAPYRRSGNPARYADIIRVDEEQQSLDAMSGLVTTTTLSPEIQTWKRGTNLVYLIAPSDQVNIGSQAQPDHTSDRLYIVYSGAAGLRLRGNPGGYIALRSTGASNRRYYLRQNDTDLLVAYSDTSDDASLGTSIVSVKPPIAGALLKIGWGDLDRDVLQIERGTGLNPVGMRIVGDGGGYICFRTLSAGAERFFIRQSLGQLIIGTSATNDDPLFSNPILTFDSTTLTANGHLIMASASEIRNAGKVGIQVATPVHGLDCNYSVGMAIVLKTASYTAANDHTILADATAGAITITLPDATAVPRRMYLIKKVDSSANAVTVSAYGTQTIDGSASVSISTQYGTLHIQSDGSNWHILQRSVITSPHTHTKADLPASIAYEDESNTFAAGTTQQVDGTLVVPRKTDPASPVAGEIWVDGTSVKVRDNGAPPATRTLVDTTRAINTASPVTGGGDLSADRTIGFDQTVALGNNARVAVSKAGTLVGTRRKLNLIEGSNVTLTVTDDAAGEKVDVTIASAGGGVSEAILHTLAEGRLSVASASPVSESSGTALYYVPYTGNRIALYDGTTWKVGTFSTTNAALTTNATLSCNTTNGSTTVQIPGGGAFKLIVGQGVTGTGIQSGTRIASIDSDTQITLSLAATATQTGVSLTFSKANTVCDVFAWLDGTTVRLEGTFWASDTARATALAYQDGILVKSGAATRRYLGTFRTDGSSSVPNIPQKRFVWNYYNRVDVADASFDATDNWSSSGSGTWSAMNGGNAAWRHDFVVGVAEDRIRGRVSVVATVDGQSAIAIDGTAPDRTKTSFGVSIAGTVEHTPEFHALPAVGYHYLQAVQTTRFMNAATFYGDNGGLVGMGYYGINSGMFVQWRC